MIGATTVASKFSDALTLFQPWEISMNVACSSVKSIMQILFDSGQKLGLTNVIHITVKEPLACLARPR